MNNQLITNDKWKDSCDELSRYCFSSSVIPLIMVNHDGVIVGINKAYSDWCGLTSDELIGKYMPDVIENCKTHIVAKTGIPSLHKVQQVFGKTILSNRVPIFDEEGEVIGAWGTVEATDIGEMQELTRVIDEYKREIDKYKAELESYKRVDKFAFSDILGSSKKLEKAKQDALIGARANIDIIIRGETGVGKELFAMGVHDASIRKGKPMITLNCSAISSSLVESELFGYEGGSFTGADKNGRPGKFEQANGGILFLDEIGDMPLSIQPKLLRAIEAREITRVGGQKVIPLDIQIIFATNANLEKMVEQGQFRKDLYYRLSSYAVNIPPLREREEDILILANNFAKEYALQIGQNVKPFSDEAKLMLTSYSWPGNVRELKNLIRKVVLLSSPEDEFYNCDLNFDKAESSSISQTPKTAFEDYERDALVNALTITKGNISKTSEILKIDRNTVYRKMKKFDIDRKDFK